MVKGLSGRTMNFRLSQQRRAVRWAVFLVLLIPVVYLAGMMVDTACL